MYLTPDLTGKNPLYKSDNNQFIVVKTNQRINFLRPVYAESINVILLGTTNRKLDKGIDWDVMEDDKDFDALSMIKCKEPDFTKDLVKSIVIVRPVTSQIRINISFQMLFPLYSTNALFNGEPLQVDPDLIAEMLERSIKHDMLLSPVKDLTTPVGTNPRMLEPDPFLERPENIIENEIHEINTPANRHFIHPIAGTFFKGTLKIREVNGNQPLAEGVDYVVFGMNPHKTKMTNHKPGAYDFILILKPIIGDVKITYHAYGGNVTLYDLREIENNITNVIGFLNQSKFITADTVGSLDVIAQLNTRLIRLEDEMRRLCLSGRPSYGDVTNKGSLLKKINAADVNLHWWTIASLFKVDGSDDIITADTFKFRIQTLESRLQFEAIVAVDLNNSANKFDVEILSNTRPLHYIPFVSYDIDDITYPQFRIIWNQNTVAESGMYLQIGLELKDMAVETVVVEDMSGMESCWKLIPEVTTTVGAEDDVIALPSSSHIWDHANTDSRVVSSLVPFKEGHLIWAGSQALNKPTGGWKNFSIDHYLDKETDIKYIKKMRLELFEHGGNTFPVTMEYIPGSEELLGTTTFSYNGKPAHFTSKLYRKPNNDIGIDFTVNIEADSSSNQLDLCHVIIFT